jgi:hypothetical protein
MTRAQLEHIIRAAGTTTNTNDVVVIGSEAVLGAFKNCDRFHGAEKSGGETSNVPA